MVNASESSLSYLDTYKTRYSGDSASYTSRLLAVYKALAREKYNLVKLSNYVNGSDVQYEM